MIRRFSLVLDDNPFKFGVAVEKLQMAVLEKYGKL